MKKTLALMLSLVLLLSLCACQAKAQESAVPVKSGEAPAAEEAAAGEEQEKGEEEVEEKESRPDYEEAFPSLDGSVTFRFKLENTMQEGNMPIVEVSPHNFTAEDARRIANVLFEDTQFFEYDPNEALTKEELRENIALWTAYLSDEDALAELYGETDADSLARTQSEIQRTLEDYTAMLETAPDSIERVPCQWTFFPTTHYWREPVENDIPANKTGEITAVAEANGYSYVYSIASRDEEDFKINDVSVYFDLIDGPYQLNSYIPWQGLCKTGEPTEEQVAAVKKKAQEMLDAMEIGTWQIDQCYYKALDYGGEGMYAIYIKAVPVFSGVSAVRQSQLSSLRSEEEYSANYYYTDAEFTFSADGALLNCSIISPVDVKQLINENGKTLSFEELMQKARENLEQRDICEYEGRAIYGEQKFTCTVNVTEMAYGLTRVNLPDTRESYYYVPAVTLRGNWQSYDEEGNLYRDSNSYWENEPQTLLVLNAADGSEIPVSNH